MIFMLWYDVMLLQKLKVESLSQSDKLFIDILYSLRL